MGIHTIQQQLTERKPSLGHNSNQQMEQHTGDFITSSLNVKVQLMDRIGTLLILQKLCVWYHQSCQEIRERNGTELF